MSKFIAARIIADVTSSVKLSELKAAYAAFNNGKTTGIKSVINDIEKQFASRKIMIGRYVGYSQIAIKRDADPAPVAALVKPNDKLVEIELMKLELKKQKMKLELEQAEKQRQQELEQAEKQRQLQLYLDEQQKQLQIELQEKKLGTQLLMEEKKLGTQLLMEEKKLDTQMLMHKETLKDKRERQALGFDHNREMQDRKMTHETIENNKNRNLLSAKMYIGEGHAMEYMKEFTKLIAVGSEKVTMSTGETKLGITCDKLTQMCAVAANSQFELSEMDRVRVMTEVDGDQTLSNIESFNDAIKSDTEFEDVSDGEDSSDSDPTIASTDQFEPSKGVAEAYASTEIEELIEEAAMSAYINTFLSMRIVLQSVINKNVRRKIIKWMNHVAADLTSGLSSVRTPTEVKRDVLALKQHKKRSMPPLLSILKPENEYNNESNTFVCYICSERKSLDETHRCHIVSRANGGDCSISNLIAGCGKCNIQSGIVNAIDARGIASSSPAVLLGTNRCKIGMSSLSNQSRIKAYGSNTRVIITMECDDALIVEKQLIEAFNARYKLLAGNEYFTIDDELEMVNLFVNTVMKHKNTPSPPSLAWMHHYSFQA
ncbi:hypothetical protein PHYPSEUDO_013287 [Phytophthora pseudosyringae]|uniref:HNH nuclease domain-containing protein n=1 Tax=Phytophthora pseudosyringae TaxID=221518 RepID=A0A8T1V654_9STRA|nr:hypothetical protein PHYPSEUDO_013287 [Phytophthora pseudosyringae]